jgi:putative aldouronate transport system substrate-binding protein
MSKKILSVALVLAMVFILAACQSTASPSPAADAATAAPAPAADTDADTTGDEPAAEPASDLAPYELVYYMYSTKASDQDKVVEEAINAIIQPKFNATIDFIMIAGGDWNDKAIPPLRAGEKIDIFWTPEWMQYMSNITNGSLLALDDPNGPYGDLINTYAPDTVAELGDFVPANKVNGFLYGVSTYKELCVPGGLIWNLDLVEKYGIDADAVQTVEQLDAVLQEFKTSEEFTAGGFYPLLSVDGWSGFSPFIQGFMGDMGAISMYIGEPNATDGEPVLYYHDPAVKAWFDQKAVWYNDGLINPDSYLTSFTNTDILNAGAFLVATDFVLKGGQVKAKELEGQSGNPDLRLYEVQTSASVNVTTHAGGSMLGIPVTSGDPARAMMYINEMHQNVDLLNTMAWGVEGVHYNVVDGMAEPVSMNGWSDSHGGMWTLGNQFKQMLSVGEDPAKYEQMAALTAEAWAHESLGFRFDRTGYDNEYAAMFAINDTYNRSLHVGVNVEAYDTMLAELEAAGITTTFYETVKTAYADWKASK